MSLAPLDAIPVYYSPLMVAPEQHASPSASKPKAAMESWQSLNIPLSVRIPNPVTRAQLYQAHEADYVDAILAGRIPNGFGNCAPAVADTLPYTCGAMLGAATEAISNRRVAVAPVSGFHHAGYRQAAGFCTFNGLIVTAIALFQSGLARRVGILDFDIHEGDGTEELIKRGNAAAWITHVTAGHGYGPKQPADAFLAQIPRFIDQMADCDVILYQAGADPHINDPLGGWLTTEQLAERDRLVFELASKARIPIAWNLAGGYQRDENRGIRPVLDIHDNTMRMCATAYL